MPLGIRDIEYYMPEHFITSEELADKFRFPLSFVEDKIGIRKIYISSDQEKTSDLAVSAVKKIFNNHYRVKNKIEVVVVCTQTPDYQLPHTAGLVQKKLGLKNNIASFDLNLGCSGFVYALAQAGSLVESGLAEKGLIVCSEKYSQYVDVHDRSCKPLFSDASAAALIERSYDKSEIIGFDLGTDGSGYDNLIVKPDTDDNHNKTGILYMNGGNVFLFTMSTIPKSVKFLLKKVNMNIDDIDIFIFHQASKIVIDTLKFTLKIPEDKIFINYNKIGNTVSASIPIAIKDALSAGKLYDGCKVMFVGFGVGLSWGSCIMKWNNSK